MKGDSNILEDHCIALYRRKPYNVVPLFNDCSTILGEWTYSVVELCDDSAQCSCVVASLGREAIVNSANHAE